MPRKKREAKERRYVVNKELLCVLANCGAAGGAEAWESFWGPERAREAFEALRAALRIREESYVTWRRGLAARAGERERAQRANGGAQPEVRSLSPAFGSAEHKAFDPVPDEGGEEEVEEDCLDEEPWG
jgi:hypothetical protein